MVLQQRVPLAVLLEPAFHPLLAWVSVSLRAVSKGNLQTVGEKES
jgi:hypothetical protein